MFEFSISEDKKKFASLVKFMIHKKASDNKKGSGTFMFNTNCEEIKNEC